MCATPLLMIHCGGELRLLSNTVVLCLASVFCCVEWKMLESFYPALERSLPAVMWVIMSRYGFYSQFGVSVINSD